MKNKKVLFIGVGVLVVALIGIIAYVIISNTPRTDLIEVSTSLEVVSCEMDTKICPDGNIVVRDSNNGCDFYDCPVDTTNTSTTSGSSSTACTLEVKTCPDGTQVGRESTRSCQFKLCADGTQLQ